MKTKIEIEIDVDAIAKKLIAEESEVGSRSLSYQVEQEIKRDAINEIKKLILQDKEISTYLSTGWTETHITKLAVEVIDEKVKTHIEAHVKTWLKDNAKWFINDVLRKTLDTMLLPRLQKMINNIIVVDQETAEMELAEMESAFRDEAKGAYEAGIEMGYEEVRKSL